MAAATGNKSSGKKSSRKNSLLNGILLGMVVFYAPLTNASSIYKVIDQQTGRVTFTDNVQKYEQQTGKKISQTGITTETHAHSATSGQSGTANTESSASTQTIGAAQNTSTATKAPRVNYQLTMTEPSEERAYHRPAQNIVVNVQLKPALQAGDSVSIYLDGNQVTQGLSASIATVDLLPGAHTIKVVVSNEKGQSVAQVSRTVYVLQNTAMLQNNKKIAQQLLAYEQLPWHQKVLLKLRQDGKQPNIQSSAKPQADTPMTLEQPAIK
ncbi:hypothetical protein AOC03_00385 [Psychrobacter urativorans]|uniref:DUF4124 domain-containing protein n=2 Tax=Psychrobacter urativorans TaxID=45610 RepID=A0A0M5MJP5_9GAMM|nr:hypothetical protein AOC03_00385 [Psychrobacter urativorans]